MSGNVFTSNGLTKARQIIASLPLSHRDLLIQSARSTNSTPRNPIVESSKPPAERK